VAKELFPRIGTLGLGGLFIYTKKSAAVGDVLRLVFDVPAGKFARGQWFVLTKRAAGWVSSSTSMQFEARARLTQLLRRLT